MRTPLSCNDYFCCQINTAFEKVQKVYLEAIKPAIAMHKASVMLGDGTVTQLETFDPNEVQIFYQRLTAALEDGWLSMGINRSITEDLHRLYCQFANELDRFYISGYFGVQFHTLPYYRVDKRVIEIQKELAKIATQATALSKNIADAADSALKEELEKMGYGGLGLQELFIKMFDDERLAQELYKKAAAVESKFPEFEEIHKKRNALHAELNNLITELYQTSPVLIDYNRLMQGEEGIITYFDIEVVKNKKTRRREAYINTASMKKESADMVAAKLEGVARAVSEAAHMAQR